MTGTITEPITTTTAAAFTTGRLRVIAAAAGTVVAALVTVLLAVLGPLPAVLVIGSATVGLWAIRRRIRAAGDHRGARPRTAGPTETVLRFRVTAVDGRVEDCRLTGTPHGRELSRGQIVDVYGRRTRLSSIDVREVVDTADQTVVRGRRGAAYLLARAAGPLAALLAGAAVVLTALVLLTR